MQKNLSLINDISQVPLLAKWIEELGQELSLPMSAVFQLNLALEEAVVNVMNYAYPGEKGRPITIAAKLINNKLQEERIIFILADKGVPFDPTKATEPDITLPAEQRNIGGLGIFLVQQLMEGVIYKREEEKNILTMVYRINRDVTLMFDSI